MRNVDYIFEKRVDREKYRIMYRRFARFSRIYIKTMRNWVRGGKFLLHALTTKKGNIVIATAFGGKIYGDNPGYIIEMIHDLSPITEIVWICSERRNYDLPSFVRPLLDKDEQEIMHYVAKASVIIDNNRFFTYLVKRKNQLVIETWHGGLGFKKMGNDTRISKNRRKKNTPYDFYLSNSQHLTRLYRSAFGYHGPVWECGFPIEDAIQINDSERTNYHAKYHIPNDTNVILYVPTFRTKTQWKCTLNVERVVDAFKNRYGGEWIMAVHWHHMMSQEEKELSNAVDVTDTTNIQNLVKAADACITDYSSSIFQAVQCHIPCFVYADDYEEYNMDRGLYYPLDEQPFPYAFTNEQLINNILHYDAALWEEKWQQYRKRMGHIVTGHSAEDVAKVCVDFLNGKPKADIMKEIPFETRF